MKSSEIKKYGKKIIFGKRKSAIMINLFPLIFCVIMTLIVYGIVSLSQSASNWVTNGTGRLGVFAATAVILFALSVFTLCAYSSTSVGEKAWYGGLTASKKNYTRRFLFWFKPKFSLRALRFKFTLTLLKATLIFFYTLPAVIIFWTIFYLAQTGGLELYLFFSLVGGGLLLGICGLSFAFVAIQRYFLAEYIFSSDPKMTVLTAIAQSKNLLDGHILEIVRFKLSFFPWFIGCLLIFPAIYFVPYYKASCSLVAKQIVL